MLKQNYHTHTYRCGHAIGTDEEYILEALAFGITELGFSDHIFLPDQSQMGIRGDYSELEGYITSLKCLKEKYKNRIKIHIGFEAEAMEQYFPYYQRLLDEGDIEYLILGNHCECLKDGTLRFFFSSDTRPKDVKKYTKTLIEGMKTGLFKAVAHPDYFMGSYKWNHLAKKCTKKICRASLKYDIPLEFNFGAIRRGKHMVRDEYRYNYPYDKFWKIVKKYGCKVMIGIDAHSPSDISTSLNDDGYEMFKELGLKLDQKLEF